jgi:hypothetical protein
MPILVLISVVANLLVLLIFLSRRPALEFEPA